VNDIKNRNRVYDNPLGGVTPTHTYRQARPITRAARATKELQGLTLSDSLREKVYEDLVDAGWNVRILEAGTQEERDEEWMRMLGRPEPRDKRSEGYATPADADVMGTD
jgi:hypothetical protein